MTDDRFDRELRDFLGARATAGASVGFRARVAAVSAETPVASPRWRSRSVDAWRGALGLLATAAVAVLVIALLSRLGQATVRTDDRFGAPSNAPAPAGPPFVEAPAGFFTPAALAGADARLRRVFAETGVEGTLIVRTMPDQGTLGPPDGWLERYDRDADDRRDVVAVAGLTPDDTILCCITMTGPIIDQARENLYWQPVTQPSALDDELSAATAAERDAALGGFVRGIEDLATGITELGLEPHPSDVLLRWMPAVLVIALAALAITAIPSRRRAHVPAVPGARWTSPSMPDRAALYLALSAFAAPAILTLIDLLRAPDASLPFDPTRDTVGIASRMPPIAPAIALSIALVALIAYALQGSSRRRLGIAAAVVLILGTGWLTVDRTRPADRESDITWTSSANGHVTSRPADGIRELVTFDVSPGETFTMGGVIRNPGVLPLTLLGLEDVRPTTGNPYVAAIVGLGWVPQPTDDGRVYVLSSNPAAASAAWPVTLAPGAEISIIVLGRAGECAEAGNRRTADPLFHVPVRYRVLGIEQVADVPLPATVFVAGKDVCTVETENATITYGPPPTP
jgi:hypothetical protein